MKKLMFTLIIMIVFVSLVFAGGEKKKCCNEQDVMAIKKVIKEAYVKGIHVNRDCEAVKKGFHPDFTMLVQKEDGIVKIPLSKWLEKIKKWKEKEPVLKAKYSHKLKMVDVTGNAAVVGLKVFKDEKYVYTDYMSLYKFKDGWKIVSKTYHSNHKHKKEKKKKA